MKREYAIRLNELITMVPDKIKQVSAADFEHKPHPDKWSKKQILGHLIDSAANNHQRFIRIQYEDVPTVVYDQTQWNKLNHYQELDSRQAIMMWTIYNQQLLHVIRFIPEEHLQKKGYAGLSEPVTLLFLIEDYVKHLEHHLQQIIRY